MHITELQIKCYHQDPMTETSRGTTTETVTRMISNSPLTNSNTHSTTTEKKSTKGTINCKKWMDNLLV